MMRTRAKMQIVSGDCVRTMNVPGYILFYKIFSIQFDKILPLWIYIVPYLAIRYVKESKMGSKWEKFV